MPLKCGYDFTNFESGWRRLAYHPNAEDPRHVSMWAWDVNPVFPPKLDAPPPGERAAGGIKRLSAFSQTVDLDQYRKNLEVREKQLRYFLGMAFDTPEKAMFRAVARAYEASDCVAMQMKREHDLFKQGGKVAKSILSARKVGRTRTQRFRRLLFEAADILEELRIEDSDVAETRRAQIVSCRQTQDGTVENLLGIKGNFVQRGRLADRARLFFVWRLTELYFLITGQDPNFTFTEKGPDRFPDDVRNPFQQFLSAAFDITGLTWTPDSLDHYLRDLRKQELHLDGFLDWHLGKAAADRRPLMPNLPSTGILIDYNCRRFYHRDLFPPERRGLDEPSHQHGLPSPNAG